MRFLHGTVLALAVALGCHAKEEPPPLGPDIQGAIMDADQGQAFAHRKTDVAFRPTDLDVRRAEAALPNFLAAPVDQPKQPWEADQRKKLLAKLPTYKRQWAGLTSGSKRVLHMNFMCRTHDAIPWKTTAIQTSDGGDCYFNVDYDLETGAFENLRVNGEA